MTLTIGGEERQVACCLRSEEAPDLVRGTYAVGSASHRKPSGDLFGRYDNPGVVRLYDHEGYLMARLGARLDGQGPGIVLEPCLFRDADFSEGFAGTCVCDNDIPWWVTGIGAPGTVYLACPYAHRDTPGTAVPVPATLSCHGMVLLPEPPVSG